MHCDTPHVAASPSSCSCQQPGQFSSRLLSRGCRGALCRRVHHAAGAASRPPPPLPPTPLPSAQVPPCSLIHHAQDISAGNCVILGRAMQLACCQSSDAACCEVLRPVLSLLSSWSTSLAAELFLPQALSVLRACVEVLVQGPPAVSNSRMSHVSCRMDGATRYSRL